MAELTKVHTDAEYINNPFFVAVEGIKLFFLNALGVAVLLVVLSAGSRWDFSTPGIEQNRTVPAESAPPADFFNAPTIIGIALVVLLALFALIVIGTLINGMIAYSAARVSRNQPASLKDAWKATTSNFGPFLWLQTLTALKLLGWSLLFIVPGFIMYYRYSLAGLSFFDKGLRGNAAIKDSLALTKGSWLTTFASQTLFTFVSLGTLSTLVMASATAVLYRQFNATPLEKRPKAHGLAIATLVVSIAIILFFIMITFLLRYALYHYATSIM